MAKKVKKSTGDKADEKFPLPIYKPGEDIYNQEKEVPLKDDEKEELDGLAKGLDIPGAELDDANEAIGEEDEENNYYSLGGDDHDDLEEDKE
jgi:hypothetical protein